MSSDGVPENDGIGVDDGVRTLLLLMPRVVARTKRSRKPQALVELNLAPRHLSLLAYLFFDGPLSVNELADRLELVPATVSLLIGELNRNGVVDREEDEKDRRRKIVSIAPAHVDGVRCWLEDAVQAWHNALEPLTPRERKTFVETLSAYEQGLGRAQRKGEQRG
ncbi:MarR family winged helix-turn-helix transcriptional regulator [Streptomyces xiamenensis]